MGQRLALIGTKPLAMDPDNSQQSGHLNPQVQPFRPAATAAPVTTKFLAHQPSRGSHLKRQITDQLVAPADVLHYDRPAKRQPKELTSQGMDKRHPSSFQQLEKVCCTIHIRRGKMLIVSIAGRGNLRNSMTPPNQTPNWERTDLSLPTRSSKVAIAKPVSSSPSRKSTSTAKKAPPARPSVKYPL